MTVQHSTRPPGMIHVVPDVVYTDDVQRDTDHGGWQIAGNVLKVAYVQSPPSAYLLISVDPTAWVSMGTAIADTFIGLEDTISAYDGAGRVQLINDTDDGLVSGQDMRPTGDITFNDLILTGDLTVQGTTTTIDTETLLVEDKNIELGVVATPTDVTADGGGITLKGTTDKIIAWFNATKAWTFDQIVAFEIAVTIGATSAPTTDMLLDLKAAKALGLPELTTTERDALAPTERMVIYNITVHKVEVYNGTDWIDLHAGTGDVSMTPPVIDNQVIVADGPSGNMVKGAVGARIDGDGALLIESAVIAKGRVTVNEAGVTGFNHPGYEVFSGGVSKGFFGWREASNQLGIYNEQPAEPTIAVDDIGQVGVGTGNDALVSGVKLTIEHATTAIQRLKSTTGKILQFLSGTLGTVISSDAWLSFNVYSDNSTSNPSNPVMTLTQIDGENVAVINQRIAERLGGGTTAFHFPEDLDSFTSGGVTTLPGGAYIFKEDMTLPNRIVFETGAIIEVTFEGAPHTEVTYSGNSTFMSGDPERVSLFSYKFLCTGTDAVMFDLDQAALTLEKGRISMTGSNSSLGTVARSPAVIIRNGTVTNFVYGLSIFSPAACSISQMVATPYILSPETVWSFLGTSALGAIIDIQAAVAGPFGSLVYVDPLFARTINLQNISQAGPGNFFQPATVTGASISLANIILGAHSVISAASEPTGGTRFTVSVTHTYQVGMRVTHEGFSIGAYDGEYRVSAIPSSSIYVLESVPFVGTATGQSATQYTQVITSGDPGVSDGDSINVTGTVNYNGGYEVFSKLSDRFGIAKPFSVIETVNYDNGSQDENSKYVTVFNCATQEPSHTLASGYVNNNATATGTIENNAFRGMTFGTAGSALISGSNTELFTLLDDVTGEYRYEGIVPFSAVINTSVTATSSGGAVEFRFSWQHDIGAGWVALPDPVEGMNQIGSVAGNTSFTTPIALNPGDLIRPVITRSTGSSGITTSYFNFTLR